MIQLEWSNDNGYAIPFNWFLFSWNQSKRNKKKCTTFFSFVAQEFSLCFTISINIIANYLTVKHSIWSKICHKKELKIKYPIKSFYQDFPFFIVWSISEILEDFQIRLKKMPVSEKRTLLVNKIISGNLSNQ